MTYNLPPGVSPFDYHIGGPEKEWEEESECPFCEKTEVRFHQYHRQTGHLAFCECSPLGQQGWEVEDPEPEYDEPEPWEEDR